VTKAVYPRPRPRHQGSRQRPSRLIIIIIITCFIRDWAKTEAVDPKTEAEAARQYINKSHMWKVSLTCKAPFTPNAWRRVASRRRVDALRHAFTRFDAFSKGVKATTFGHYMHITWYVSARLKIKQILFRHDAMRRGRCERSLSWTVVWFDASTRRRAKHFLT